MNKVKIKVWIPIFIGMTILFALLYFRSGRFSNQVKSQKARLQITTSFYPLTYLVQRIGGDLVDVTTLTPAGMEPHEFEPNARALAQLEKQDVIFLNGGGMEGYGEKLKVEGRKSKVQVLFVGERVMNIKNDPHVWLDPILFAQEAEIITKALIQKDFKNERYYIAKSKKLKAELELLDKEYTTRLKNCKKRTIVTSHNAFGYLTARYGIKQITLAGISPEGEPSAQALAAAAEYAIKNNIQYIFFEVLVSPALAETLAKEVGAKTLVLNPLEGLTIQDEQLGKTYMSIQRENLKNLSIALECN